MTDPSRTPEKKPRQGGKVVTAMRSDQPPPEPPKPLGERLKNGAIDLGYLLLGRAKDEVRDFKGQDRFFKYKAGIVALYVVLSVTSFAVACPGSTLKTRDLGAQIVVGGNRDAPVWLIKNESDDAWEDVRVIIDGRYRAAAGLVGARKNLVVTPRQLISDDGSPVPSDLRASHLELKTDDGDVVLIERGKVLE